MTDRDRMDRRFAADLETVLNAQIEHDTGGSGSPMVRPSATSRRATWVTVAVGVVVVALTIAVIQAVGGRADRGLPAASTSASRLDSSLLADLPKQAFGTVVHTWTDQQPNGSGPFAVTGSTVVIAAVCRGGGTITIHDASGRPHRWVCKREVVQQPFWRGAGAGGEDAAVEGGPVRASVSVDSGQPQFIVRMWKVDPRVLRATARIGATSSAVPVSLRTCQPGDLASTGSLRPLSGESAAVVTITSRSSSDCAVRSWPAMTYLDRDGEAVGPTQGGADINGRSLDSREGAVDRFQEFPPARLVAGGHGYLIAALTSRSRLERDDEQARAAAAKASASPTPGPSSPVMAPPLCHPRTVAAMRLSIAGSDVVVPIPTTPARAACASAGFSFGVDPVVSEDPVPR